MPNAKTYHSWKTAYLLTINGCGNDCLECERDDCIVDSPEVKKLAARWLRQKELERQHCKTHKAKRLENSKRYYATHKKRANPNEPWVTTRETLNQLPNQFTYDDAAKVWGIIKHTAIERIRKLLVRFPGCIIKEPQTGPSPMILHKQ